MSSQLCCYIWNTAAEPQNICKILKTIEKPRCRVPEYILNDYKFNYIFVAHFSYAVEVSFIWINVNNRFKLQK
ncbi:MAG TPA: hypothetical protein DEH02_21825 [Bacteroidales bacterium]|nr:hypothetical protein [Bacteroidales bacterium]